MRAHRVRVTLEPPGGDAGEPRLEAAIRDEIVSGGPITFARFMDRALCEPGLGYYATSVDRTTPAGDFVTAPELHPIFGWTLARQIDEMWRAMGSPEDFVVQEYGAGSGALILTLLDGLARLGSPLATSLTYDPIDLPAQRALIAERLAAAARPVRLRDDDGPFSGVVLANEFLDVLPVHRVVQQGTELRELYVDWSDDGFVEVAGEPSSDEIVAWFLDAHVELSDGQQAEVSLGILEWADVIDAELERGYVIAIDYGADSEALYDAGRRPTGTLRAFSGQRVSSDVLSGVGRRDITAHVDFGALERAARAAGLDVLGRRTLNEFLIAAGLDDAYAAARVDADNDWDSALLLRAAVRRLLDSQSLGGYQVAILGKGVAEQQPLSGLQQLKRPSDAR